MTFVLSGVASAQSTYGTITGVVRDPSGAVISQVKVEATNQNTSAIRTVTTNSEGFYELVSLDPGTYTIAAVAEGFSRAEKKDLPVLARELAHVDLQLPLAGAAPTVVEVNAPVVSEQLTRSDSKSGDVINSLALNFRATSSPSPIVVASLSPGVQEDSAGNFTIAGQLPTATSYSLDGVSTQLPRIGGPTRDLFPSVEGILEFRVNTAGNSAEFSQPTDVTVISRSGTNEFHGGGFWYFQRKDLNSADQISGVVPTGDVDTFGASIGGPLTIPNVYDGKNKTFFYFDYEGVRLDSNTAISTNTPPTPWRTGDFSGAPTTIVDPMNGQPFAGNKIPSSRISQVSAKLIPTAFPNPTNSEAALTSPNFVTSFPGTYTNDGFDGRLDQNFGPNHHVSGRVTQKTISSIGTDAALGAGGAGDTTYNPLMGPFSQDSDLTNIAATYSWIIRPNLVNDLRFGYTRANFTFSYPQALQGDSIVPWACPALRRTDWVVYLCSTSAIFWAVRPIRLVTRV